MLVSFQFSMDSRINWDLKPFLQQVPFDNDAYLWENNFKEKGVLDSERDMIWG